MSNLLPEEVSFFEMCTFSQKKRSEHMDALLSKKIEMNDITAFCHKCKLFSLRFASRQLRSADEGETITMVCENNCKTK